MIRRLWLKIGRLRAIQNRVCRGSSVNRSGHALGGANTWVDGTRIEGLKCRTGSGLAIRRRERMREYTRAPVQKAVDPAPRGPSQIHRKF